LSLVLMTGKSPCHKKRLNILHNIDGTNELWTRATDQAFKAAL